MSFAILLLVLTAAHTVCGLTPDALLTFVRDTKSDGEPFAVTGRVSYCCLPAKGRATIDLETTNGPRLRLYEHTPEGHPRVRLGDLIALRGVIGPNDMNRRAANFTDIKVIEPYASAGYPIISGDEFFDDANLNALVTIHGIVRECFRDENAPNWIYFVLFVDGRCLNVNCYVDDTAFDILRFLGRHLEIAGRITAAASTPRKQAGHVLVIPDLSYVKDLDPPRKDAFDVPTLDTIDPSTPPERLLSLGLHRVSGVVCAVWGRNHVRVEKPEGNFVDLSLDSPTIPGWGESIVAIGLPETNFYNLQLAHARWRPHSLPSPYQSINRKNEKSKKLSSLSGLVRYVSNDMIHDRCVYLESDGTLVPVDLTSAPEALANLTVGSRITATGVRILERISLSATQPVPAVRGMRLAVRSAEDITVLSSPPWWTPVRIWSVAGCLLLVLLAITIWNITLHRLATLKGRALAREQISRAEAELRIDERTRLAIELHDTLSQNLMGVAMRLDSVRRAVSPCSEMLSRKIALLSNAINYCREELRQCLWDLRSSALEEEDMNEVIRQTLAPHVGTSASITIRFNVPRHRLTDQTVHAMIRIVRELTLNAIQHGRATQIKIAGALEENTLLFSVADNGCGFDVAVAPGIREGHFGLQGIRERVNQLGGTVKIISVPARGTKVTIHIQPE